MKVLALTGNPGSGKTSALRLLNKKGALVFDADKTIHRYYRDKHSLVYKKVARAFPQSLSARKIRRQKLAKLVFPDRKKLKKLEGIVHPAVIREMLAWIKRGPKRTNKVLVAEVPLLFEKKLEAYFDAVILVKLKPDEYLRRLNKFYGFNKGLALKRLKLFKPLREKIKRADYIIDNSGSLTSLKKEVDSLWKKLKEK